MVTTLLRNKHFSLKKKEREKERKKQTNKQTDKQTNRQTDKQTDKQTNREFTCIAGVGLGGSGGGVGHGRAEEDGRFVHIDLETVYVALVQVVYLEQRPVTTHVFGGSTWWTI